MTPDRPLEDYLAQVSERTDTRTGVPLPRGAQGHGGGVNVHSSETVP